VQGKQHFRMTAVLTLMALAIPLHMADGKIRVVASTVPTIASGSEILETGIVDIPRGASIVIIETPQCQSFELKGPYRGTIAEYLSKQRSFWTRVRALWDRMAGKDDGKQPVGGTRGGVVVECR
jgi:hypothetical protein